MTRYVVWLITRYLQLTPIMILCFFKDSINDHLLWSFRTLFNYLKLIFLETEETDLLL